MILKLKIFLVIVKDYFRIHDSAGLGDGKENDERHAKNIINELAKKVHLKDDQTTPYGFIDMAMVILDEVSILVQLINCLKM